MRIKRKPHSDRLTHILHAYRLPTLIISCGLLLAVVAFLWAVQEELRYSKQAFRDFAEQYDRALDTELKRHESQLNTLARVLRSVHVISEDEFTDVIDSLIDNGYFIHASQYNLFADGKIDEPLPSIAHKKKVDNLAVSPDFAAALQASSASSSMYTSAPFDVQTEHGIKSVTAIIVPISPGEAGTRFLVGLMDNQQMLQGVFRTENNVVNVRVYTYKPGSTQPKLLFEQYEDAAKDFYSMVSIERQSILHYKINRKFSGTAWDLYIFQGIGGFGSSLGFFPWFTFFAVLAVTGLLGYLTFRITVENLRTGQIVDYQTQALRDYTTKLEQSNRELDDFAYIASHDLKEPLRGIHNFSQFLLEDYGDKLDQDGTAKLETLKKLSARMQTLIDSLLYYARLGRTDLAYERTDLNQIVLDVLDLMEVQLLENNATVTMLETLPRPYCDKVRIGEVFRNLITNALKYNTSEAKRIEIGVARSHPKAAGELAIFIRDNGIGIPPQHLETIFKIFKRLHGRDEYGGGTGSGLTIVKKIIDRHEGHIWVESDGKTGTTFYFTLGEGSRSGDAYHG